MEQLPASVRWLNRVPYKWKSRIFLHRLSWRICHGLCRRSGWNTSQLGWWPIRNGPYRGLTLEIWHTHQLARLLGIYEPAVTSWLTTFLSEQAERSGPQCIWDVGANMGLVSMLCAKHGRGTVTAFEPLDENLERFRRHLERNPDVADRIRLVKTAVSDREGDIAFSTPGATDQCQIRDDRMGCQWNADAATITVPTTALDTYARDQKEVPTLVKIDVEGAEALVLAGAGEVLSQHRPTLLIEVHGLDIAKRCLSTLSAHGYQTVVLGKHGLDSAAAIPDYGHLVASPSRV